MTAVSPVSGHRCCRRASRPAGDAGMTGIGASAIPFVWFICIVVFVAALLIVYLCECARTVESQYEICRLNEMKNTLERQRRALQIEVNRMSSLERIETIARRDLGMVQPPMRMVIDLTRPTLQAYLKETVAMNPPGRQ